MSQIVKLKDYKIAKKFEEDFASIDKVIDLSIRGLVNFKQYKPVVAILHEMNNQRTILQAHNKVAKKILDKDSK